MARNNTKQSVREKTIDIGIATIHSFKGWELKNILLYIPETVKWEDMALDSMIYTAITRTRQNLIVFNANKRYWDFGEKLPHSWDDFM